MAKEKLNERIELRLALSTKLAIEKIVNDEGGSESKFIRSCIDHALEARRRQLKLKL